MGSPPLRAFYGPPFPQLISCPASFLVVPAHYPLARTRVHARENSLPQSLRLQPNRFGVSCPREQEVDRLTSGVDGSYVVQIPATLDMIIRFSVIFAKSFLHYFCGR